MTTLELRLKSRRINSKINMRKLSILKRMENFTEESNVHDRVIMNKIIAWKGPKNQVVSLKENVFPKIKVKKINQALLKSQRLCPSYVVEPYSSFEDEESEGEQSDEKDNIVE